MAFQVVHPQRGLAQRSGQGDGNPCTHQQRASQARPARVGHKVDVCKRTARRVQDIARQRHHAADVVARRQLRHHTAVSRMHLDLAVERLGQKPRRFARQGFHQRHASLVARRFESEHFHRVEV